jgi:hypothetical protein
LTSEAIVGPNVPWRECGRGVEYKEDELPRDVNYVFERLMRVVGMKNCHTFCCSSARNANAILL